MDKKAFSDCGGDQYSNVFRRFALASLYSAGSLSGRHAQHYLNRIINPTVDLLFVIPYIVVQEVVSSFSRNNNTLIGHLH